MNLSDSFFNKIEKKTNVNKETIMSLAQKLQQNDLKNEENEIQKLTDKKVEEIDSMLASKEREVMSI